MGRRTYIDPLEVGLTRLCSKALKGERSALFKAIGIILEFLPPSILEKAVYESNAGGAKLRFAKRLGLIIENGIVIGVSNAHDDEDDH
jgi:hypothetical protein